MPKPLRAPSIPAPFKRDAISLDHPRRVWQDTPINRLKAGDMIRDFGVVGDLEIQRLSGGAIEEQIRLKVVNGVTGDIRYWTFDLSKLPLENEYVPTVFAFSEG